MKENENIKKENLIQDFEKHIITKFANEFIPLIDKCLNQIKSEKELTPNIFISIIMTMSTFSSFNLYLKLLEHTDITFDFISKIILPKHSEDLINVFKKVFDDLGKK